MTTQTEALKLALEAYLCREMPAGTVIGDPKWWVPRIANSIKEALAQPEQEPVPAAMKTVIEAMQQDPDYAWGWHCNIAMSFVDAGCDHYTGNQGAARFMRTLANVEPAHELPSTPQQRTWVGLTDDEMYKLWLTVDEEADRMAFGKAVEAKLKEKNA